MASIRSLRPLLFALALPLVACGGGDDDGDVQATGPHYTYVASQVLVPTNTNVARDYGLDLNGDKTVDNALGMVLATLGGRGLDVQSTIKGAVDEGDIILLVDFQSDSFTSSAGAGFSVKLGQDPTPPACNGSADTVCGNHLKGTGTFTVSANSPNNAAVTGKIVGGTFTGGPGDIALQIALGGTMAIQLDLIGARVKATGITENGMTEVILAGALPEADLEAKVIPAIHSQIAPLVMRDCTMPTTPPGCGCTGVGKTVVDLFDTNPKDCTVSLQELTTNALIVSLLAPDVTIDGVDALSLGVKAVAVKGTFPTN